MNKILPCKCHKVSSLGRVYSLWTQFSMPGVQGIQSKIGTNWKEIKCLKNTESGYKQVSLHGKTVRVNRLVAFNFLKNPFGNPIVCHKDGDKDNNESRNLYWGTHKTNGEDKVRHGNSRKGIKNHHSKLDDLKVKEIRTLRNTVSLKKLSRMFNVSTKCILLVCQRKTWRHVK